MYIKYTQAKKAEAEGDMDAARELFAALCSFKDSADKLKQTVEAPDKEWGSYKGVRIFEKDGKFGLMDNDGSVVCDAICDRIYLRSVLAPLTDNWIYYYSLECEKLAGIYDPSSRFLLMPEWETGLMPFLDYDPYGEYISLTKEGKSHLWSLADDAPVLEVDTRFLGVPYEGMIRADIDEKYCFIDMQGNIVLEGSWDYVSDFDKGSFA